MGLGFLFPSKSHFNQVSKKINKKLFIKFDVESSLVAGTVLLIRHRRIRESRRGGFTKESLGSLRSLRPFSFHGLSSKLEAMNEKSPARMRKAFSSRQGD